MAKRPPQIEDRDSLHHSRRRWSGMGRPSRDGVHDSMLSTRELSVLSQKTETFVSEAARAAFATDEENRVVDWNRQASDLLGFSTGEVIGRNLQAVIRAKDIFGNPLCETHCTFHQMVRRFEAPESFELDVFTSENKKVRVAVNVVIVLSADPATYRLIYVMTPLRRRRRSDEAIDRLLAQQSDAALTGSGAHLRGRRKSPSLTARQREVLALLVVGRNSREIAEELGVSVNTVRSHVQSLLKSLGVSSRLEAVSKAVGERIL
jgi:DNA-binding CsgD family transcriptional regulator/PAS domain-containing protein